MSDMNIAAELRESFQDKEYAHAYVEDFLNAAVATQIKVLREDRQLTQDQLAELTGMKQARISLLENVNYGSWSMTTLRRLAVAFDVTLKVSFEAFSKAIDEVSSFSREALQRPSRTEDIKLSTEICSNLWNQSNSLGDSTVNLNQPESAFDMINSLPKTQELENLATSQALAREAPISSARAQWIYSTPQWERSLMGFRQ